MPRGGHSRSGPPPDPNSFRSAAQGATGSSGWIRSSVPTDPAPAWPMGEATEEEAALWADLWTRPPASAWGRFHLTRDVAVYVRTLLAFEHGGHSNAALGSLVQRLADQLGLTVAGAHRNRWTYPDPAKDRPATVTALPSVRPRTGSRAKWADKVIPASQPDKPPF
ncbi:hypothetical protein [Geodermatophilus sp. URMC 62]|uniref:hypothetical protein n=1 Tax=Geodermatophilus sp. URMC 62 TaxID=3423414 RepID=UPI00406C0650